LHGGFISFFCEDFMFSHFNCHPKWQPAWRASLLCLVMPVCMAQHTGTHAGHISKITHGTATSAKNNGNSAATSNPGNTMMAAGKVRYCSIFTQYQRLNQQSLTPWRESNEAVQQAGGWMALAHEARAPESASMSKHENCPPGVADAFTQGNLPLTQAQAAAPLLQNPLQQADAVQLALRNSPALHADRQRGQQAELAAAAITQVMQVRQAWVRAVAAQQSLAYARQVYDSAEASAELARRMQATGNFSKLMRVRQQVFYAAAATQLATSQHQLTSTREELVRALGLNDEQAGQMRLPQRLPDLPASPRDVASFNVNANASASAAPPGATNSPLRELYSAWRTHHDIALHYRDEVVPLHKTILDENLLRYNGMLSGVFEVLNDAREQINSVIASINAAQDFWLADAALQASIMGVSDIMNSINAKDSTTTGSKP
jgi:Outer membrane efflux protein